MDTDPANPSSSGTSSTLGVKLAPEVKEELGRLARAYGNTASGLARLAIDLLLQSVRANDGQLPKLQDIQQ